MTIKIQAGTVSHGTLRNEDLIQAFAAELRRITTHPGNLTLADEADAWIAEGNDPDSGPELCNDLIDLLNDHAPEGMYFGAHEGDGSDFGWWPVMPFDVERPGGCGAMRIDTISDLRKAMRHGPYAWPGGYPCYFVMADGEALSFKAARENVRELLESFRYNVPCWRPVALDVNWDDTTLVCAHTNTPIESAYGDPIEALERPGGCGAAVNPIAILWTAKSRNSKTGPIPVSTTEPESCPDDCPLKDDGCYAGYGPLGFLWRMLAKFGANASWVSGRAVIRSTDWSGLCASVASLAKGTLWRHNQAGDLPHKGGKIDRARVRELVRANKGKRGFTYTHHNVLQSRENRAIVAAAVVDGFTINLSGNNMRHADMLADLDVAPVVCVLSGDVGGNVKLATPKGRRVVVCPATYRDEVSCATCGLCQVADRKVIVGFPAHGQGAKRAGKVAA